MTRSAAGVGVALVTGLVDRFGRVATDLRVALTDRFNLRCTYCMPAEGLAWLPREEQLTDDEVGRLIRIGVELLGIAEVRFTGGQPPLRGGGGAPHREGGGAAGHRGGAVHGRRAAPAAWASRDRGGGRPAGASTS